MSKLCKIILLCFFLLSIGFFFSSKTFAVYNPTSVPNNFFGIHIINTSDLDDAAKLVNSQGGDWGYVTFVINLKDRNYSYWQEVFNKMRRLHLIPIVRIATRENSGNWEKPDINDIDNWVNFFNSLNWVIKNRYIIVGNEVNLGKEWGGMVNPEEYSTYLKTFTEKLKKSNSDYFILLAGLDASLPTTKTTLEEATFLKRMVIKEPLIFELIDGISSHSYPNPNFSGSEYATGKGTVRTFDWEISFLKSLGVSKILPVFITETGWAHKVSGNFNTSKFLDESKLSSKFNYAFNNVWNRSNVIAVTPFILNYEYPPFDMFSWKTNGSYNSLYTNIQNLKKTKGEPIQNDVGDILRIFTPAINFLGKTYTGLIIIENKGQKIWNKEDIALKDAFGINYEIVKCSFDTLEPGMTGFLVFKGLSSLTSQTVGHLIYLTNKNAEISNSKTFKITSTATIKQSLLTWLIGLWHPDR